MDADAEARAGSAPAPGGSAGPVPAEAAGVFVEARGLRFVRPYEFTFRTHVKARWRGTSLRDLFRTEFPAVGAEYFERAVARGAITVGGAPADPAAPLREGQLILHRLHRHEPPVVGGPIAVLGDSGGAGGLVAVTKPASMPVHASGQHRHNTLLGVLAETRPDLGELFPLHRLDKPVSGVVVLARSSVAADGFRRALEGGAVRKLYLARVCGRLPETELLVEAPVLWDDDAKASRALGPQEAGEFEKAAAAAPPPAASWAPRPGRGRGCPKSAATYFRHLAEGPDGTSLVLCAPITGRTHQIRVHLAYSGCPIANDEKYGGSAPPASPLGTPEEVEREVRRVHGPVQGVWDHCPHCPHWMPSYSDLAAVAAPLFLHAHRYTGPGWEFESPPPGWAAELLGGAPVPHVELPGGGRKNAGNACVT